MNKILIITFISIFLLWSCRQKNCAHLSNNFLSYEEAKEKIKSTDFKIKEDITLNSSWLKGADFYSCDGNIGYLIIQTETKDYLHAQVPKTLWEEFKYANSPGEFYNKKIKNKFTYNLTK